jgi:hypothetical protein
MVIEDRAASNDNWLTINQIADLYGKPLSTVRSVLKRDLPSGLDKEKVFKEGSGRRPDGYHPDFVQKAFGVAPPRPRTHGLTDVLKDSKPQGIKEIGRDSPGCLATILQSRLAAETQFNTLVQEMARTGKGLRIRCLTGTDFFNSQKAIYRDFQARKENPDLRKDKIKVLLLYPFGEGAHLRSLSEGDKTLKESQFYRDARATFEFLSAKDNQPRFEVKWVEPVAPGLLIWTEDYALLEPYDYGRDDDAISGCIGRRAPVLIVNGGTPYHSRLRNGFDFVFDGTHQRKYLKTYNINAIRSKF